MILVFDLDDTLYEELTFVRSGFAAVAAFAAAQWGVPAAAFLGSLHRYLRRNGRGTVFDAALREHGVTARLAVTRCLAVYRAHQPAIALSPAACRCLERFASLPKYVVTDGNALVQERKVRALRLTRYVRKVLVTHRYGRRHAKPSPYCLLRIARAERVEPSSVFYIADNPAKDFVGIKPLGFRTIRLLQGPHAAVDRGPGHDAEVSIRDLDQLTWTLLQSMTTGTGPHRARRDSR